MGKIFKDLDKGIKSENSDIVEEEKIPKSPRSSALMSSPAPASASEAVSTLRSQLTALSTGGASHRELGEKYRSILDSVLTWKETDLVEGLKAFIEAIINENVSLVISRQVEVRTPIVANLVLFEVALI